MIVAVNSVAVVFVADDLSIEPRLSALPKLPRLLERASRLHRDVNKREARYYTAILAIELVASVLKPSNDLSRSA